MDIWNILLYVVIFLIILSSLILFIFKPLRNKYYYEFQEDKHINKNNDKKYSYDVYEPSNNSNLFINKYVIARNKKDICKYCYCHYNKKFRNIYYYVLCYDYEYNLIGIKYVKENLPSLVSSKIKLFKNTSYINIIIRNENENFYKSKLESKVGLKNIHLFALLTSILLFSSIYVLRYFITRSISILNFRAFNESATGKYLFIGSIILSLVNYFVTYILVKKDLNGGDSDE